MAQKYYTDSLRYPDKGINANERYNYSAWITEQIDIYGQLVDYHVLGYSLTGHDAIYGEQPGARYDNARQLTMYVELNESSIYLSRFGIQSDDDVTAFIPIVKFQTVVPGYEGHAAEPKAGDVFTLNEYGNDRLNGRGGKSFEITQRVEQENTTINPLMGHYVWLIKAKRLDYTFEPGLGAENKSDQVYDNTFAGRLSGYTNLATAVKTYDDTADVKSADIFNYGTINDVDDVYGDYN